ncbi:chromatin associated protein KTI12 [Gymnopilus junonius]|uniref:Chromatin associated protein KTI12 n=1 Tax=Gymnopilus junonius TaxID=109634 RepID=A0A9P5NUA7_GYMJU|nr:chromatin associated protein KTI12 [Gymnopilus junonius]
MALITLSGLPCAGKSTRAQQIAAFLDQKIGAADYQGPISRVVVLSDHSLGLDRNSYADTKLEKPARGALFSAVQRQLSSDTILIVDSLNYIKGFRYQMYCAAREMKLRTSTVYVVAGPNQCRQWNLARPSHDAYSQDTLENLLIRFEEPSSMVRWDAPLFTIVWDDPDIPGSQIWEAATKGNLKPPNSGTLSPAKAPVDALHILEHTTAIIASAIASASNSQPTGGLMTVSVGQLSLPATLPPRNVTLSELQRLKRQFVTVHKKAITLGTTERGAVDWKEENVAKKFVDYVEAHLQP